MVMTCTKSLLAIGMNALSIASVTNNARISLTKEADATSNITQEVSMKIAIVTMSVALLTVAPNKALENLNLIIFYCFIVFRQ